MIEGNPTAPVVTVRLDRERRLSLDFNAIVKIEGKTGRNLLVKRGWANLSGADLLTFVWAGLLREDPELRIEQVGEMIHLGNYPEMLAAISEAWEVAAPKRATNEGDGTSAPLTGTSPSGSTSGASGDSTSA